MMNLNYSIKFYEYTTYYLVILRRNIRHVFKESTNVIIGYLMKTEFLFPKNFTFMCVI